MMTAKVTGSGNDFALRPGASLWAQRHTNPQMFYSLSDSDVSDHFSCANT